LGEMSDDEGVCECGSSVFEDRESGSYCAVCGLEASGPELDPGFVPVGAFGGSVGAGSKERLGSEVGPGGGRVASRLRRTQSISQRRKPSFLQGAIRRLEQAGEGSSTTADAVRLLREVDREAPIGRRRNRFRGSTGMSKADSKAYRTSVYAAAALHVLNDSGRDNRAPQIADEWGLAYLDLAWAISMLNQHRRRIAPRDSESPESRRSRELRFNLVRLRDFLATRVGFTEAGITMRHAESILEEQGEPVDHQCEWLKGRFCNKLSKRAAMIAFAEAMTRRGMSKQMVKWLRDQVPITGTKEYVKRLRPSFAVEEE